MANLLLRARCVLLRHVSYGYGPARDVLPFNPQSRSDTTTCLLNGFVDRNHLFTVNGPHPQISSMLSNAVQWKVPVRQTHLKSDGKLDSDRMHENMEEKKTSKEAETEQNQLKLSQKEKLKRAVREYGATVIVFHTCISLFTLGVSYAVVSSGVDVVGFMAKIGVGQQILESKLATGASTFVIAYAVHKVFAPARIACTLTATPFIVRYLRKIGFLKAPIPKS